MAVTARFVADYESFFAASQKAVATLKGFEEGAGKVEKSLNRMVDQFSGRKLIQEATIMNRVLQTTDDLALLTGKELQQAGAKAAEAAEKMRRLGLDVPPGLQKIADAAQASNTHLDTMKSLAKDVVIGLAAMFTIRAAANFVGDVLKQASALQDLSNQTHINVEEIQLLAGSMSEFGVDADTLAKGLFGLSRRIAKGDDSVEMALRKMGLSLSDVQGLNGEELFLKIEHGLSTLQGGLRDTTASELFGSRLGMAMAGAADGIDGALDSARRLNNVMSTESVRSLDQFGESLDRANRNVTAMAANLIGPLAEGFNVLFDTVAKGGSKWQIAMSMLPKGLGGIGTGAEGLTKIIDDLNKKTEQNAAIDRFAASTHEVHAAAVHRTKAEIEALAKSQAEAASAAKKFRDELEKHTESVRKVESAFFGLTESVGRADDRELNFVKTSVALRAELDKVEETAHIANFGFKGMADGLEKIGRQVDLMPDIAHQFVGPFRDGAKEIEKSLRENLMGAFQSIPGMISSAFLGGGGFLGAVKGIGSMIGSTLGSSIGKTVSMLGSLGGPIGAAIGSLAGPLVGLFGKLFGESQASKIHKQALEFVNAAGGAAQLRDQVFAATGSMNAFNAVMSAKKPEQLKAAIDALNGALEQHKQQLAQVASGLDGVLGAAQGLGGGLPAALQPMIQALLTSKNLTDDQRKALGDLASGGTTDYAALTDAAGKYGLSLADLGPKFQQANLDKISFEYADDFRKLVDAGASADNVIKGMAPKVQALIDKSAEFGGSVPESMKPLLQKMVDLGLLVDTSGKKFTDLSGFNFNDNKSPLDIATDKLVKAIEHLGEILGQLPGVAATAASGITSAIAGARPELHIGIVYDDPGYDARSQNAYAARGGLVTSHGIEPQYLGIGGRVLPFRPRGTDTVPAMLTPGERVLTKAQNAAYERGGMNMSEVVDELRGLRSENQQLRHDLARLLPKAIRDAIILAS